MAGDLDREQMRQYRITVEAREDQGMPLSTPDTVSKTFLINMDVQ